VLWIEAQLVEKQSVIAIGLAPFFYEI